MLKENVLKVLKKSIWEYSISDEDLYSVFIGQKKTFSLNREKLIARMLVSVGWYDLIENFTVAEIKEFLSDKVLSNIFRNEVRSRFEFVRRKLNEY